MTLQAALKVNTRTQFLSRTFRLDRMDSARTATRGRDRICVLVKAVLKARVMTTAGDRRDTHFGNPQGGITHRC